MRMTWMIPCALMASLAAGCGAEPTVELPNPTEGTNGVTDGPGGDAADGLTTLAVTPDNAKINFVGTKDDGRHDGGFENVTGSVAFDPADLTSVRFTLEIDTTSLWSDNEEKLTPHLKSPDFFEVNTYPTASFATTGVTADAAGTYTVTGDLTLHGVTKTLSFPATIAWTDPALAVTAAFKIDRQDFGISYGTGKVHDEVSISAAFSGTR